MEQKNHIRYAQAKGAPAGFVLPYLVLGAALARHYLEDVEIDTPTNITLNTETALVKIHAIGGGLFVRAAEDVSYGVGVKANVLLTLVDNPTHGDVMQLGSQPYTFRSAIQAAAYAILTLSGVIVPGSHAESVVTANTIVDGSQITIGTRTYTFKTALSAGPTVADEVLIGGSDAVALDNLKLAINAGAGIGTNYSIGTVVNADVVATDNAATTQKIVARVPGTAANTKATTSLNGTLSWPDTTLGGGTGTSNPGVATPTVTVNDKTYSIVDVLSETNGATAIANQVLFGSDSASALDNLKLAVNLGATAGVNYSTGTTAPTGVTATTNANDSQRFEAAVGVIGNAYASTTTIGNGSFAGATFVDGWADDGHTIVIDVSAATTQTRVRKAINGTGTAGTDYSSALVANDLVYCNAFASDDAVVEAQAEGSEGDGITSTATFASGNNFFSAVTLTGSTEPGNFDGFIPAGGTFEFAPDENTTSVSVIALGASTDVAVVEY